MGRQKYEFRGPKRKERPRKDWVLHTCTCNMYSVFV